MLIKEFIEATMFVVVLAMGYFAVNGLCSVNMAVKLLDKTLQVLVQALARVLVLARVQE